MSVQCWSPTLFRLRNEVLEGYAYGKLKPGSNNKWTGMVGALQEGRADLTVSELSIIQERSEVISYTQPLYIIRYSSILNS